MSNQQNKKSIQTPSDAQSLVDESEYSEEDQADVNIEKICRRQQDE